MNTEQSNGNFIMYCDCIPKPPRDKEFPNCCSKCGGLYRESKRKELIKLNIPVKCKNCEQRLFRLDDPFNGFCSEKCIRIFKGIKKIKPKDLTHIIYWYYYQRKNEHEQRINKRSGRGLGKLLRQLGEIVDD